MSTTPRNATHAKNILLADRSPSELTRRLTKRRDPMSLATGQLRFDRTYPISPDRLWHLLIDPDMRCAWGAPSEDHILHIETADVREGGSDRHRCGPKDAPEFFVNTQWHRLMAPELACFTETLDFEGARVSASLVSYAIRADGTGCSLAIDVYVASFDGPDMIAEHEAGWTGALERLPKLFAETQGTSLETAP